jgi:hypothetical protein
MAEDQEKLIRTASRYMRTARAIGGTMAPETAMALARVEQQGIPARVGQRLSENNALLQVLAKKDSPNG